ncbi:MAG: hypothetical protein GEU93_17680 [Propionibacteriales bacterium]|nr:hypothetical protein [Propionibacteriales bacterium]
MVNRASWEIRLETLRVNDADEDDFWSDGDEPYLVAVGFRSKFRTAGSTQVFWSGVLDDEWAEGVEGGQSRGIPASMGVLAYPDVELPTRQEILAGSMPELVGAFVLALESDATPFGAVRDKIHEMQTVIREQLLNLIERGNIDLQNPGPSIAAAQKAARDTLTPSVAEAIGLWLRSFADPDDFLGVGLLAFGGVDPSAVEGTGLPVLTAGDVTLSFGADGVSYDVLGRIVAHDSPRWRGFELVGANTAATSGSITAVSRIPNSMEVWFAGGNGSVQDKFWYEGGNWQGFELAGANHAAATGSISAVSRIPNSMEVFWVGANGSVQGAYWYEGGNWGRYELAPAGSASTSGSITAISRIPNSMEVFFVGANGSIQDKFWYEGANWQGFELAPAGTASTTGSITAISRIPNSMEVFFVGANGSVQDKFIYLP